MLMLSSCYKGWTIALVFGKQYILRKITPHPILISVDNDNEDKELLSLYAAKLPVTLGSLDII